MMGGNNDTEEQSQGPGYFQNNRNESVEDAYPSANRLFTERNKSKENTMVTNSYPLNLLGLT